jgi:hypothetical protein
MNKVLPVTEYMSMNKYMKNWAFLLVKKNYSKDIDKILKSFATFNAVSD